MNMSSMTIKTRLWILTAALVANILIIGTMAWWNSKQLIAQLHEIADTQLPAARYVAEIDMFHDAIRSAVYHSLIGTDKDTIDKSNNEFREFSAAITEKLTALDKLQVPAIVHNAIVKALPILDAYKLSAQNVINLSSQGLRNEAFAALPGFDEKFEDLEKNLEGVSDLVEKTSHDVFENSAKIETQAQYFNIGLVLFGMFFGFFASFFLIRAIMTAMGHIVSTINQEVVTLTSSASHLQEASNTLAESTTEQSAAIEETAASIEEISAMISQTAQNADDTLKESRSGQDKAQQGREVVQRMVNAMAEIQDSNEKLSKIVRLIEEIRNKTKVINDIAFETRLLSFNASIEAARAGAHGKGFAVVAEEVGKLASVSGKAADEIRSLLESSMAEVAEIVTDTKQRVGNGQEISRECESSFSGMGESLVRIADAVNSIASAAREQESGVKQTNTAMTEMDKVTQRNSRSADVLAGQVTSLMDASLNLKSTVTDLQYLLNGSAIDLKQPRSSGPHTESRDTHHTSHISEPSAGPLPKSSNVTTQSEMPVATPSGNQQSSASQPEPVSRSDSRWRAA